MVFLQKNEPLKQGWGLPRYFRYTVFKIACLTQLTIKLTSWLSYSMFVVYKLFASA